MLLVQKPGHVTCNKKGVEHQGKHGTTQGAFLHSMCPVHGAPPQNMPALYSKANEKPQHPSFCTPCSPSLITLHDSELNNFVPHISFHFISFHFISFRFISFHLTLPAGNYDRVQYPQRVQSSRQPGTQILVLGGRVGRSW